MWSWISRKRNQSRFYKVLKTNGYPASQINKISQKISANGRNNHNPIAPINKPSYLSIPYVSGISERISRIFKKYDLNVAHQPTKKLKNQLCHLKDKRKVGEKAGVVYKLDCKSCDAKYVGETGRHWQERMNEHKRDIVNKKKTSKVFEHVSTTKHSFDFDNVSVLDNCSHKKVRLHLESVHSYMQPNSINRSLSLNSAYKPLLQSKKWSTFFTLFPLFYYIILQHFKIYLNVSQLFK